MNANPVVPSKPAPWSSLSLDRIREEFASLGCPPFRARQLHRALNVNCVVSWSELTDLPQTLRHELARLRPLRSLEVVSEKISRLDGSRKLLLSGADGGLVESVMMVSRARSDTRTTVCVSSQIGCPAGCTFCASGLAGFSRNLAVAEIVDQVAYLNNELPGQSRRVDNIVFMGMGEPFMNYRRVMSAITWLRDAAGLGFGARHVTVSTVGIVPGILRFAEEAGEVNLAISLHAPNDELRSQLVPYNAQYPIRAVLDAAQTYVERTKRRVSFEYVLLQGVNDAAGLASDLGRLLRPFGPLAHVNLIPWNPFPEAGFDRATRASAEAFAALIAARHVNTTIRYSKGLDIDAACGQLRRRSQMEALAS